MPSIQRRAFLGTVATASLLAGCATIPDGTGTESATPSDSPTATGSPTPPVSDRIRIVIDNGDAAETTVDLRLTDGDRTLLDRRVTAPGDGRTAVDTGIEETGEYELDAFVVGGPDLAFESTIPIEEYDLRQGSNVILLVDGEQIDMWMEE